MNEVSPITIVVPLYGDLPTAERCIRSVLETVDLGIHRLLLVNDCGPEVEEIERVARGLVEGIDGARYVRNPRNLGFVGTCNRAALELDDTENDILLLNSDAAVQPGTVDEMSRVLHLSEKHGVVTARSNHATIATIPVRPADGEEATPERSLAVFRAVSELLPRYTIVPVAHGFCFLARRSLIRNHGLFDTAFDPGYGEENDFCLRVNALGYSSVMANHAYAHHEGERSFRTLERQRIQAEHEELLVERYPFYPASVDHYLVDGMDVVDRFADFLVPSDRPSKVLIDLHHMSLLYDGSVRNALTFLEFLRRRRAEGLLDDLDIVVGSTSDAERFFDLSRFGFRVTHNDELDELFDVGFSLAPVSAEAQIQRLDRLCLKWVASHLDIIALRSLELLEIDYGRRQVVRDSLRFADRVIAISQATVDDTLAYFPELATDLPARTIVLHQGVASEALASGDEDARAHHRDLTPEQRSVVDAGDYILVVGNAFPHKQLEQAVAALRGHAKQIVVFGGGKAASATRGVTRIPGGYLSDAEVSRLYDQSSVVVYPSAYEGFGLPVAESALHGKPIVLFETAVSREVVDGLEIGPYVVFFDRFDALRDAVAEALTAPAFEGSDVRSITEYSDGVLEIIRRTLDEPVSVDRLRHRYAHFSAVRAYGAAAQAFYHRRIGRRSVRLVVALSDRVQFLRPLAQRLRRIVS